MPKLLEGTLSFVDKLREKRQRRKAYRQQIEQYLEMRYSEDPEFHRRSSLHNQHRRRSALRFSLATHPSTIPEQPKEMPKLHFSFSGGGWLMVYMYGVAKALREQRLHENAEFIGTSAGCLSIVSLVLGSDFDAICESVIQSYVPQARGSWSGPFNMREYLVDAITTHGNVEQFEKLNDKVTVVYTSLSAWESRRTSRFHSSEHLLHTMVASCCATPLVGLPFKHEGEWVIDGGLMDNQPLFHGKKTITISPNVFSGADIRPSRYVPAWWSMYPPSQRDMKWLYELGYEDALTWMKKHKLPGCEHLEIPTKAANYDGQWETVVGQVVGYRSVENFVLKVMDFLGHPRHATNANVLKTEMLFWKLIAILTAAMDRVSVLWTILATATLAVLVLLDQQYTLEFVLVSMAHSSVALMTLRRGYLQVNSSEQWKKLQDSVLAMEAHSAKTLVAEDKKVQDFEQALTPEQHDTLAESSFIYRMSSAFV